MATDVEYPGVDQDEDERRKPWGTPSFLPSPGELGGGVTPPAPTAPDLSMPPAPDSAATPLAPMGNPSLPPRPLPSDYPPAEVKHPFLKRLAIGAAAFGSPEQGEAAHRHVFEEPREIAQHQYEAAAGAYDTQLNQGLAQRKEQREEQNTQSQVDLRRAQAGALEPKVMVKVPWQDEPIPMSQKGAEQYYKTQQVTGSAEKRNTETVQGRKDVADINADAKKQNARQPIRVMGERTYERTPDGTWKDIGKAPARTEPGNYAPINDENGATLGWVNPKSGHMVKVDEVAGLADTVGDNKIAPKPSGQTRSRQDQAAAIDRASTGLIQSIDTHRDKVGNVKAILESAFLNTPLADADQSAIAAELSSYAALQPALHGFRGQDALREFTRIIGGIPKDPDALIAAIKAIQKTAGYVNPALNDKNKKNQPTAAAPAGPPKTGAEYIQRLRAKQQGVQ